ncbi:MAG: MFS transporter [Caenibius sp.]
MATSAPATEQHEVDPKEIRLVITASSAGTVFEWYDFFIYATLTTSGIIGSTFFPSGNLALQTLLAWAGFAVGFGFRPLGAILFGYLGDKLGRKYTFLVTITLMGLATAGIGLIPSTAAIGSAAPILLILCRVGQGLALGGEYGGAAIYVSEHSPPGKRGFYTSFIQASVIGGFVLSLAMVLLTKSAMSETAFVEWGWRLPFLFSLALLAVSLWMRLMLSESPVFAAMREEGEISHNPFIESFTYPGNPKRIFVALFGIAAGLTTIWYTAMVYSLEFLKGPVHVSDTAAELIVCGGALLGSIMFIVFGKWSDKVGRKRPIIIGYVLTLLTLFPLFWAMGNAANPSLEAAAKSAPVVVSGADCAFDPFAKQQSSDCGKVLALLTAKGVKYTLKAQGSTSVAVGTTIVDQVEPETVEAALNAAGYDFNDVTPSSHDIAIIIVCLLALSILSGMTYGPVAALLSEMFPPKIRYSSMSIPYHFGTGYFGGFLPFIASYIAASTGDPYSGLWYTWGVVLVALIVGVWGIPNGPPRDFSDDAN